MSLNDLAELFNRAFKHSFSSIKWAASALGLVVVGLLFLFCRSLGSSTGGWLTTSLTLLPLFLSIGFLAALGVVVIRLYHDELKNRRVDLTSTVAKSLSLLFTSTSFSVPLIIAFLLLWMLLGLYQLLSYTPLFGTFFGIILSFVPFLIYVALLLLAFGALLMLFFLLPRLALTTGWAKEEAMKETLKRFVRDPFSNFLLFFIALTPLIFSLLILFGAISLTGFHFQESAQDMHALHWLLVVIPFGALLAPALNFFYQFALEAHVYFKGK